MKKKIIPFFISLLVIMLSCQTPSNQPLTKKNICQDSNSKIERNILNLLSTGIDQEQLPEYHTQKAQSYVFYCSQCHSLQKPSSKSSSQWKKLIYQMHTEMNEIQQWLRWRDIDIASQEELKMILDYLSQYSLQSITAGKLVDKKGKKEFVENCSTCHDLPDPNYYRFNNWDTNIKRMNHYRKEQGLESISQDTIQVIKIYLNSNFNGEKK